MFVPHKASTSTFGITPQKRKRDFNSRFAFPSQVATPPPAFVPQVVHIEGTPSRNATAVVCGALPREVDVVQMFNDAASDSSNPPSNQSGHIDETGWAWLCTDKQVFLWEHHELTQASVDPVAFVRPLPPPCGDAPVRYKASLVKVWQDRYKVQRPGLTVVSPNGVVWFWAEIHARERPPISIELPVDVDEGETCVELLAIEEAGFLVATNKGKLFQVLVWTNHQLRARELQAKGGIISGLGKMLGYRSEPVQPGIRTLLLMQQEKEAKQVVVVLTQTSLQQWKVSNESEDAQLMHEDLVHEQVRKKLGEMHEIWLLDLKQITTPEPEAGFLLLVARQADPSDPVGYSLFKLKLPRVGGGCEIDGSRDLEHEVSDFNKNEEEDVPPGSLHVVAGAKETHAYVHWAPRLGRPLYICGVLVTAGFQNTSKHTFSVPSLNVQDRYSANGILGAGTMPNRNALLLMNCNRQVIRVEVAHERPSSEGGSAAGGGGEPADTRVSSSEKDSKNDFVRALRRLLKSYAAAGGSSHSYNLALQDAHLSTPKLNSLSEDLLSAGVLQVSRELCNEVPGGGKLNDIGEQNGAFEGDDEDQQDEMLTGQLPGQPTDFSALKAQLVHHTLRKKRQRHELLLQVLKIEKLSLWSRVTETQKLQLLDHGAKLKATEELCKVQQEMSDQGRNHLLFKAMRLACQKRACKRPDRPDPAQSQSLDDRKVLDLFYSSVTQLQDLFECMDEEMQLLKEKNAEEFKQGVQECNYVCRKVVNAAHEYGVRERSRYEIGTNSVQTGTNLSAQNATRTLLEGQVRRMTEMLMNADTNLPDNDRRDMFENLQALSELLLVGYKSESSSPHCPTHEEKKKMYEEKKKLAIDPLVDEFEKEAKEFEKEQGGLGDDMIGVGARMEARKKWVSDLFEWARGLAEKHEYYEALVRLWYKHEWLEVRLGARPKLSLASDILQAEVDVTGASSRMGGLTMSLNMSMGGDRQQATAPLAKGRLTLQRYCDKFREKSALTGLNFAEVGLRTMTPSHHFVHQTHISYEYHRWTLTRSVCLLVPSDNVRMVPQEQALRAPTAAAKGPTRGAEAVLRGQGHGCRFH
jgi:hypothetical protein